MANNPSEAPADDFLQEIFGLPNFGSAEAGLVPPDAGLAAQAPMILQLSSGDSSAGHIAALGGAEGAAGFHGFPSGLSLEKGKGTFLNPEEASGSGKRFGDGVADGRATSVKNVFHGQPTSTTVTTAPHPPAMRPKVRARRGQATDPHSIAERVERIAERIRALQELVPSINKTDRAAMLDEIVDYVKFLRLQAKVLSISRVGAAGAVAPLVADIPPSSVKVKDETGEGGRNQPAWEKWSNDGTEQQVAKLMEENVGAAMQYLQSKDLCIMPISLAMAIYHTQPPDTSPVVKPETNPPL